MDKNVKILVCDDDEVLISMIRFKLTRENIGEVDKAQDGREAMSLIRQNAYDLVITDIYMPFHSGLEIITLLRTELKRQTPIIVLSAEGLEETVLQAFELGANDFLSKPFSPNELMVRVKRLLNK
ncbi:MAG TPA: response regulator transcription factor [Cyclobacteriaceae bacterium]|nr:response regulator transcription factor [Cyclobacteriaceae bacterium]